MNDPNLQYNAGGFKKVLDKTKDRKFVSDHKDEISISVILDDVIDVKRQIINIFKNKFKNVKLVEDVFYQ